MSSNTVTSVQQIRIVAFALIGGPTIFLAVVAFVLSMDDFQGMGGEPIEILTWGAAATPLLFGAMAFVLRQQKWSQIKGPDSPGALEQYAGGVLLFFAPIEGAALFNGVAWMMNGNLVNPFAAAVAILLMAANLPSQRQLDDLSAR